MHAAKSSIFTWSYFLRLVVVNLCAAAAAAAIRAWVAQNLSGSELLRVFLAATVYSFAIGMPSALVLPLIAEALPHRPRLRLAAIAAALLAITAVACLAGARVVIAVGLASPDAFWPSYWFSLRLASIMALTAGFAAFAYEHLRDKLQEAKLELRTRQMEQERANKLAAEARLSSLESRIHPHFLFNTLNSISALIPDDPKRAEEIVGRLAALLRFSLDSGRQSLVPLSQELKVVRDYLEIERARFGERLRYSIELPAGLEHAPVPALALQTLVENSVKHVISVRREGGEIRVEARAGATGLELEVSDSGTGFRIEDAPAGHGLENLAARLAVLFGDAARIEAAGSAVRLLLPHELPSLHRR